MKTDYFKTKIAKVGGKHRVEFTIGHQTFGICCGGDTKKECKWMKRQLNIALQALVKKANRI